MSVLRFGSRPANMFDAAYFGYAAYVPGENAAVEFTPSRIVLTDPVVGSSMVLAGAFDDSSEWALYGSPLTGIALYAGPGDLLFDWSQLALTLGEFLSAYDVVELAGELLGGDDTVLGGAGADLLFADPLEWHERATLDVVPALAERMAISGDGSVLAAVVWRDALPDDPLQGDRRDVVLIDPDSGAQTVVSSPGGVERSGTEADMPTLTRDGGLVVFTSSDPAYGGVLDPIPLSQVVARDTLTMAATVVSSSALGVPADADCEAPVVSADGSLVAFTSRAHNLLDAALPSFHRQVFAKNLVTGEVELVSSDASGAPGFGDSYGSAVSGDGRYVFFASDATHLVDAPLPEVGPYLYVKDLLTGEVEFVANVGIGGSYFESDALALAISLDGRVVAFTSLASDLVPDDTNNAPDIFVRNLETGVTERVSVDPYGMQLANGARTSSIALSGDGEIVAFHSTEGGLVPAGTSYWGNVYVRDMYSGLVDRVSGFGADNAWSPVALTADGATIAFTQAFRDAGFYLGDAHVTLAHLEGRGHDLIAGGGGDDLYIADATDTIAESFAQGEDTLIAIQPVVDLPEHVEHFIYGGHGYVDVLGNALDNTFSAGVLGDTVHGAGGTDTLLLGGARAEHAIARLPGAAPTDGQAASFTVTDLGEWGATDQVSSVERLVFEDLQSAIGLDIDGIGGRAYRLYQAAFDRVPDPGGLGFWIYHLDRGFDFAAAAANFMTSPEFVGLYGANPSNLEFIRLLYLNVQNREPDQGGYDFWTAALVGGTWDGIQLPLTSRAEVLLHFSDSPENYDNVIDAMSNGYAFDLWLQ